MDPPFPKRKWTLGLSMNLVAVWCDDKQCSYEENYMKRQHVFACFDCTPHDLNAGFCKACAVSCHQDHQIVGLLTKRNFKCDCGNSKFSQPCKIFPNKDITNFKNSYNHNFKGNYCTCGFFCQYPNANPEMKMMQCCICEDWFHETHIGDEIPKDDEGEPLFEDFMCKACSEKLCFLKLYPDEILATRKKAEVSKDKLVLEDKPCESNKPIGETSSSSSAKLDSCTLNQCPKSSDMHVSCLLGVNLLDDIHDKPLFLAKNWRDALCKCNNCLEFYNKKQIAFLLDKEDSAVAYEKMAKQKREEKLLQQQKGDSLEILKGVEDAIGQMKDELRTFRESAEASKPITVDDVYQFLKKLENKRCTFQESESTDSSKPDCKRPRLQ